MAPVSNQSGVQVRLHRFGITAGVTRRTRCRRCTVRMRGPNGMPNTARAALAAEATKTMHVHGTRIYTHMSSLCQAVKPARTQPAALQHCCLCSSCALGAAAGYGTQSLPTARPTMQSAHPNMLPHTTVLCGCACTFFITYGPCNAAQPSCTGTPFGTLWHHHDSRAHRGSVPERCRGTGLTQVVQLAARRHAAHQTGRAARGVFQAQAVGAFSRRCFSDQHQCLCAQGGPTRSVLKKGVGWAQALAPACCYASERRSCARLRLGRGDMEGGLRACGARNQTACSEAQ